MGCIDLVEKKTKNQKTKPKTENKMKQKDLGQGGSRKVWEFFHLFASSVWSPDLHSTVQGSLVACKAQVQRQLIHSQTHRHFLPFILLHTCSKVL